MLVNRITFLLSVVVSFGIVSGASAGNHVDGIGRVNHERVKRQVTCPQRYKDATTGHTRCLQASPTAESLGAMSQEDIQLIVDIHNTVRSEVTPTATNMVKMSWDDSLAITAMRWAMNCQTNHDPGYKRFEFGRFSVGQNLAWGTYAMGWETAVNLWANEKKDFTYNTQNTLSKVGHYTQMVWAETVKVGCSLALCNGKTHYYVCNYGPAGNFNINKPYKTGQKCAECPDRCNNNLCDCGNKVCLNGAEMDLNTCACKCTQRFQVQPDCGLNCTDIENTEPRGCPQYGAANCPVYSNVPLECPGMCNVCPGGDFRTINQGVSNPSGSDKTKCSTTMIFILGTMSVFVLSFF